MFRECLVETARRKLLEASRSVQSFGHGNVRVPIADQVDRLLETYEGKATDIANQQEYYNTSTQLESLQDLHSLICQFPNDDQVPILDLMVLAGFVQDTVNDKTVYVNQHLTEKHYTLTGIDEDPLFSSLYSPNLQRTQNSAAHFNTDFLNVLNDGMIDADTEHIDNHVLFDELAAIESNRIHAKRDLSSAPSFVNSLVHTAKSNLHKMKHDVQKSLIDTRGSQIHLSNYKEFIEKKKKQRIQCLRDLKEHCCTCRGPHVAKPPFSHGKDYRREPTHEHIQNEKCSFLRKKKRELKWLEETIAKYDCNAERFKSDILKCEDETERRKVCLKDTLANSLRLMDMAN